MTKYESIERVSAIWGKNNATIYAIDSYDNGRMIQFPTGTTHKLDANGHPTCHKSCKQLETIAYERGLLK